ncbi:MAG: MATE family efflux transporter [Bacteroidales bacterium]|nr:MATE family efflux transporter [Bacteroidales bacterium]
MIYQIQNARSPMVIAITVNLLNVGFSIFFVKYAGMTAGGVALGTLIAQYIGVAVSIFLFARYYGKIVKYWNRKAMMKLEGFKVFFRVNSDILIRTLLLTGTIFFNAQNGPPSVMKYLLAVNSALLQFLWVYSFFIDGFAFAAEALVGRYVGANHKSNLKRAVKLLFLWGVGVSLPMGSVSSRFQADFFLHLLTDVESVYQAAQPFQFWTALIPVVTFAAFMDGISVATAFSGRCAMP